MTITEAGPVTRQLEGVISAAGTGMFKHEVGPGGATCAEDEAGALTAIAGIGTAATKVIAMAGASARIEIRNRMEGRFYRPSLTTDQLRGDSGRREIRAEAGAGHDGSPG